MKRKATLVTFCLKNIGIAISFIFMLNCFVVEVAASDISTKVKHTISTIHPSLGKTKPVKRTIEQVIDSQGDIIEYYLDVPSVICGTQECAIIKVRLVWDSLGYYSRCEFPVKGEELTKKGHEPFTKADYAKLDRILSDRDSSLKEIDPKAVVSPAVALVNNNVDAVSGATALSDKNVVVAGAAYTCYTLWHWVNSSIQEEINAITAKQIKIEQLIAYMNSDDERKEVFAIQNLTKRSVHDKSTFDIVFALAQSGSTLVAEYALSYFESIGPDSYYNAIEKLFREADSDKKIIYLFSLTSTSLSAPQAFYERFSDNISELKRYQEVHLFLSLMTRQNSSSNKVVVNTIPLLENNSFKIARKAYKFLKHRDIPSEQASKVDVFKQKFSHRL